MLKNSFAAFVLFLAVSCSSIPVDSAAENLTEDGKITGSKKLLPFRQNNKSGFIDTEGKIVIEARFDGVHEFSEHLAAVYNGVPYAEGSPAAGFIDEIGKSKIPMIYREVWDFSEGLAAVSSDGDSWGYIDSSGKMMIAPVFSQAGEFHNGMAMVGINTPENYLSVGFIDKSGNYVIKPQPLEKQYESGEYYGVGDFVEDLAQNRVKGK